MPKQLKHYKGIWRKVEYTSTLRVGKGFYKKQNAKAMQKTDIYIELCQWHISNSQNDPVEDFSLVWGEQRHIDSPSPWAQGSQGPISFTSSLLSPPNVLLKILLCPRHGPWMKTFDVLHKSSCISHRNRAFTFLGLQAKLRLNSFNFMYLWGGGMHTHLFDDTLQIDNSSNPREGKWVEWWEVKRDFNVICIISIFIVTIYSWITWVIKNKWN